MEKLAKCNPSFLLATYNKNFLFFWLLWLAFARICFSKSFSSQLFFRFSFDVISFISFQQRFIKQQLEGQFLFSQLFCPWFFFTISFIAIGFALSFSPQFHKTQLVLPFLFLPNFTKHNWFCPFFFFPIPQTTIGWTICFILPLPVMQLVRPLVLFYHWQLHNFCNSWFFLTIWTNCFYQC